MFNFLDFQNVSSNSKNIRKEKKISYTEALNKLKQWILSNEDTEFDAECLKVLPENTIITLLHKNPNLRRLVNDYLNNHMNLSKINKMELVKYIKFLAKRYCLNPYDLQPLYKQHEVKTKIKYPFVKPYELPLLPKDIDYSELKKSISKNKIKTFKQLISKFKNIKNTRQECKQCTLRNGIQVLFDTNSKSDIRNIDILFVAEAPGETETIEGIPLIGKAGQKLRPFINMFFHNKKYLLTNVCLCRPENNRAPTDFEMKCCSQILDDVIKITNPKLIVALGGTSISRFGIDTKNGILKLRQHISTYKINNNEYKVFCTVHPSYILRNQNTEIYKEDFSKMSEIINLEMTYNNSEKGKVHSIKLKDELYTNYNLINIQQLKNKMLYIFQHNKTKENKYITVPIDFSKYYYFTNQPNDEIIKPINEVYLSPNNPPKVSEAQNITLYESDIENTIRHTVDYYFNKTNENKYDPKIMFLDIEVATKNKIFPDPNLVEWPISIISFSTTTGYKISLVNMQNIKQNFNKQKIDGYDIIYCKNEKELLKKFIEYIDKTKIDIITAWNVSFDIGYILNRYEKKLKLSTRNFSPVNEPATVIIEKDKILLKIPGLIIIDLLTSYRTLTYGEQESYTLGYTAEIVLGESKLESGSDFGKIFETDLERAIKYNIDDVNKIEKINKKLGIIEYLNELRNIACIPWEDVNTTSKIVEGNLLHFCKKEGYVLRSKYPHVSSDIIKIGGYVKTPIAGLHDNIYLVDFKSLYPSIIMTYNIGPDTYIGKFKNLWDDFIDYTNNKEREYEIILYPHTYKFNKQTLSLKEVKNLLKDKILTPYGTFFEKHEKHTSIFYDVLTFLLTQRNYHKKLMKESENKIEHNNKQRSYKEIANSNYGYFGFEGSRIYITDIVNSVTVSGQYLIKLSARYADLLSKNNKNPDVSEITNEIFDKWWIEKFKDGDKYKVDIHDIDLESVVYTDTDSIYFQIGSNPDECKKYGDKLFSDVNQMFKNNLQELFHLKNPDKIHLLLEPEAICRGYWPGKKKRYAYVEYPISDQLNIKDITIKGLETQRSDYPRITRQKLKELLVIIFTSKNLVKDIEEFSSKTTEEMRKLILDYDITICKPVSYSTQDYKKVPSHVIGMETWNILNNRQDFRPGTKGYQFFVKFNKDNLPDKYKTKINKMLQSFKFKGEINNIAIPEDTPKEEIKRFFNKWNTQQLLQGNTCIELDVDRMLEFVWSMRVINLVEGLFDISYLFGLKKTNNKKMEQFNVFNF